MDTHTSIYYAIKNEIIYLIYNYTKIIIHLIYLYLNMYRFSTISIEHMMILPLTSCFITYTFNNYICFDHITCFHDDTILCNNPDSIPPLDRSWLLVAWSADFANVGPTLACQPLLRLDVSIFC